jgi:hypothetical protein
MNLTLLLLSGENKTVYKDFASRFLILFSLTNPGASEKDLTKIKRLNIGMIWTPKKGNCIDLNA